MAKILLIETATEVCSTAIAVDGQVLALKEAAHAPSHSAVLTLQIEACITASGIPLSALDAIAVSAGPGSYTSLRVGVSTAKGLCYALGKPLLAVDTLLALAAASWRAAGMEKSDLETTIFLPMLDARRQEVWMAAYDHRLSPLAPAQPLILENNLLELFLSTLPDFSKVRRTIVSGNGGKKLENVPILKGTAISSVVACSAAYLAELAEQAFKKGEFQDLAYFEPVYMKPPNITVSTKNLF